MPIHPIHFCSYPFAYSYILRVIHWTKLKYWKKTLALDFEPFFLERFNNANVETWKIHGFLSLSLLAYIFVLTSPDVFQLHLPGRIVIVHRKFGFWNRDRAAKNRRKLVWNTTKNTWIRTNLAPIIPFLLSVFLHQTILIQNQLRFSYMGCMAHLIKVQCPPK